MDFRFVGFNLGAIEMSKVTAKFTAKGIVKGESVVIECTEYDGNDEVKRRVTLLKNGKEDNRSSFLFRGYVGIRYADRAKSLCCYNPPFNSAAAYWLALEDFFDAPPETTTEGNVCPRQYNEEEIRSIRF